MVRSSTRIGPWFALTLALPCAFAGVWLWLQPGGVVERTRASEHQVMTQLLRQTVARYRRALEVAGMVAGFVLEVDPDGRAVAPFRQLEAARADELRDDAPPEALVPGVAEQAAFSHVAGGRPAEALPFFEHAAQRGGLTPEGWIAHAEAANASGDLDGARRILNRACDMHATTWCGSLPFELAALLVAARWTEPGSDVTPQRDAFCRLVVAVSPHVAPALLDDLEASPVGLDDTRADALRAAAAVRREFANGPLPDGEARCRDGTVVISDRRARRAFAVRSARADGLRAEEFQLANTLEPTLSLAVGPSTEGLPTQRLDGLGETWSVRRVPGALSTSSLLVMVATGSLVLALATFVIGNLLLWRLTRREAQLVRMRADFVDVVSHELRTPLTALSLKTEMLAAGDVPERRRQHYLHGLQRDVQRLSDQVERVLDFGRLQKHGALRRDRVPGRSLLARGLREGRPALRLVEQRVHVDVPRQLPTIVGDLEVLGRAIRNLLENTAKYAPPRSTVTVRAYANGRELTLEVADRGPGVSPGDRHSIFQPFVRGSEAPSGVPGSGLGLALVAAAAEEHGGRIEVAERSGGGAVFTIHLPVAADAHRDEEARGASA
ncbi:MAG: sensor histidine kinase [Planctomycetota bacterium]